MDWAGVEGQWKQRRGEMVNDLGKIMNDKTAAFTGKHEQLVENLKEKYGIANKGKFFNERFGDKIAQSIESLPVNFRSVVLLGDIEGLGYTEIAKTLACPVGTVCSRLHRGRKILQQTLLNSESDNGNPARKLEDTKYPQKESFK